MTFFLNNFRCRNPVELFAKSGSRQRLAVLSRHPRQLKGDSFARATLSLTGRDTIDNASQSFTDTGDIAWRL